MMPRVDRSQCFCGKPLQSLATNFYHCAACGRSKWGDESISGGWIALIVLVTIVLIVVLGYVGSSGQQYR
jgi:hypothetical protein